jgi:hypothetical protein
MKKDDDDDNDEEPFGFFPFFSPLPIKLPYSFLFSPFFFLFSDSEISSLGV